MHYTICLQVLESIQSNIQQLCRFQGGRQQKVPSAKARAVYRENYCPIAEVLTAVHGVCILMHANGHNLLCIISILHFHIVALTVCI